VRWDSGIILLRERLRAVKGVDAMALDLPAIVCRLQEVEARHPDVADELNPVIQALTGEEAAMIGIEQARELLGAASADEVGALLTLGILPGTREAQTGQWTIPLAAVLGFRRWREGILAIGGEDLTEEELAILSETRPGTFPWQRAERQRTEAYTASSYS
jgi:hypothetical protein